MEDRLHRTHFKALARRLILRRARPLGVLAAIAALVLAAVVLGLLEVPGSGTLATPAGTAPSEPQLGGRQPAGAPTDDEPRPAGGGRRPTVVQVLPPGGRPQEGSDGSEDPPRRVLEDNEKLRRELEHLKELEAERRRVSRTLAKAGAIYDGPVRLGAGGLAWPVGGPVVSPFGQRWGRLHAGIDIAARAGTVIHAAANGRVVISGPTGGYGNYVCIQHTARLTSCYAHLSRFLTERGAVIRQGQPIGLVGCTGHCFGDHLHFETWVGGQPVDPMSYL